MFASANLELPLPDARCIRHVQLPDRVLVGHHRHLRGRVLSGIKSYYASAEGRLQIDTRR